jgi:hypothetical protein
MMQRKSTIEVKKEKDSQGKAGISKITIHNYSDRPGANQASPKGNSIGQVI